MSKPVIILGGGGHAAVLIDSLKLVNRDIIGIADPALTKGSIGPLGVPVIGSDDNVLEYSPKDIELINGVGSLPKQTLRKEIFERFEAKAYYFSQVIHPSAILAKNIQLSTGVQIMAGCVIQANTNIGKNTIINTRASIDHDCNIHEHCHIAPSVTLSGGVTVNQEVHIGTGAIVIEYLTVGPSVVVGAGAVVTKDLEMGSILYPAKPFKK